MPNIGNLWVSLTARTAKFEKGLTRARKRLGRFSASAVKVAANVARAGVVMGTGLAAGTALLVRNSMRSIDATAKLADRIGTTTKALGGLRHAAEITGAGTDVMDKALAFLSKTLGEASTGAGKGKQALELLGISVEDVIAKDPAEAFTDIAGAVSRLGTLAEQNFVANKLFGGGEALVNTLALGKKGLAGMQREAEKLGLTFSRIDAAQVENANDAIYRLKSVITGAATQLAIRLAPFIEAAAAKLTEMGTSGEGMAGKVINGFESVLLAVAKVGDYYELLKAGVFTLAAGFGTAIGKMLSWLDRLAGGFKVIGLLIREQVTKGMAFVLEVATKQIKRLAHMMRLFLPVLGRTFARAAAMGEAAAKKAREASILAGKEATELAAKLREGKATGALGRTGEKWSEQAKANALKATQAYRKFATGATAKKVTAFFDEIRSRSRESAENVAKAVKDAAKTRAGLPLIEKLAPQRQRQRQRQRGDVGTMAHQMNLAHMAVNIASSAAFAPAREKKPMGDQGDKLIDLMERLVAQEPAANVAV